MFMSLVKSTALKGDSIAAISWRPLADIGVAHPAGQVEANGANGVRFLLSKTAPRGEGVLSSQAIVMPKEPALLRVDEVCFPVGAIAHRHTHAGAGIRHLVRGSLRIETADHTQVMSAGDSWFEPANSPVRAVALQTTGVSSFVRAMVMPASFAGKSTFALLDPADADLPRLQLTHRHIDLPLHSDAG